MSLCGYRKLQADRTRSRWLVEITYKCTQWADNGIKQNGNWASVAFYSIAKYACLLFANLVNVFWLLGTQLMWGACRQKTLTRLAKRRQAYLAMLYKATRSEEHTSE